MDLNGQYLWKGYDDDKIADAWSDLDKNEWHVMLELKFNLFDGFKTTKKVSAEKIGLKISKKALWGLRQGIVYDVRKAWENYTGSKKTLEYSKIALDLEDGNMKAVMKISRKRSPMITTMPAERTSVQGSWGGCSGFAAAGGLARRGGLSSGNVLALPLPRAVGRSSGSQGRGS